MSFMICHRALLSAATSTGSGLPEDGPGITRRALEAAKTALAIKADPDNLKVWRAIDLRKDRWNTRARGEKPKRTVNPQFKGVDAEPLYQDLQAVIGTLSDFTVHFTPEHVTSYEWVENSRPDGTIERWFGVDKDVVAMELLMMSEQHLLIIRVFDRCLDGKLLEQPDVKQVAQRAMTLHKDLLQPKSLAEGATNAGGSLVNKKVL
jgi:hypothetical protein